MTNSDEKFVTHGEFTVFRETYRQDMTEIKGVLTSMRDNERTGNRSMWGLSVGIVGLMFGFVTLITSPMMDRTEKVAEAAKEDNDELRRDFIEFSTEFEDHRDRSGHPAMIEITKYLEKESSYLRELIAGNGSENSGIISRVSSLESDIREISRWRASLTDKIHELGIPKGKE